MPQSPRSPLRVPRARSRRSLWLTALAIAAISGLRLCTAGLVGLGDAEAYYWVWSRHLAPGYLDHGPVVAWLIRAGTELLGAPSPLAVRLPFILISAAFLGVLAAAARSVPGAGPRAGLFAVLSVLAMPAFQVAGGAANPDVPLMLWVVTYLWALLRAARPGAAAGWWALAGLCAGLAVSTKLFGLGLVPALLAVVLRQTTGTARWRALGLALGPLALGALPYILWNGWHGWPTLVYHLASRHTEPVGPSLANLGKLVGGQLLYFSPVVLLGLFATARLLALGRGAVPAASARILLWTAGCLAGPGLLLILLVPGAEPHWPAAGYVALTIGLAVQLEPWLARRARGTRRWVALAAGYAALVGAGIHVHVLTDLGVVLMPRSYEPRYDLSNELRGWPQVATALERSARGAPSPLVAGCHYTTCGQLAFWARGRYRVVCPSPRLDQFDLLGTGGGSWPGSPRGSGSRSPDPSGSRPGSKDPGISALLYLKDFRFPFDARILYRCQHIDRLDRITITRAGRPVRQFEIQRCVGYRGLRARIWPPSPTAPAAGPRGQAGREAPAHPL